MNLPMYRFLPNLVAHSLASLTGVCMRATTPTMFNPDGLKLFEPDTLVPEQFYATIRRTQFADPERRLMAALLEDPSGLQQYRFHQSGGEGEKGTLLPIHRKIRFWPIIGYRFAGGSPGVGAQARELVGD